MTAGWDHFDSPTVEERERLAALRAARGLSDLLTLTGTDSEHVAYFEAKQEWFDLRGKELAASAERTTGIPGNRTLVDGRAFHVHGVTHADTPEERSFLREWVSRYLANGDAVYCEQGIRPMYFDDFDEVFEMDDYRWAMAENDRIDDASPVAAFVDPEIDGLAEDVDSLVARVRDAAFSLVDDGSTVDESAFRTALGDVLSSLLTGHEAVATGDDFQSFRIRKRAAEDPAYLVDLQHYYAKRFLPQPVEREWLRRHDIELEVITHGRNERMADYAVYDADDADVVHLVVGAAHQPGVTYYLERFRDGERSLVGFDPIP